ncbi:MAG: hypothetical protein QM571_03900 [Micrococcaceae bacterium]
MSPQKEDTELSRRSIVKGAVWSVPVVASAVAVPAMAASPGSVGNFHIDGTCGVVGLLGKGFTLTAAPDNELPVGTVIDITSNNGVDISALTITGGVATINALSKTHQQVVLTAPLAAGQTMNMLTVLSVSVAVTLNAVVTLPAGYTPGSGAKATGKVVSTLILCTPS